MASPLSKVPARSGTFTFTKLNSSSIYLKYKWGVDEVSNSKTPGIVLIKYLH